MAEVSPALIRLTVLGEKGQASHQSVVNAAYHEGEGAT